MKFVIVIFLCLSFFTWTSAKSKHLVTTTTTTTEAITTVTKRTKIASAIDVGICDESQDLHSDGTYLKTLCTVSKDLTYEQARAICTDAGMHLFVINNSEVQNALQDASGIRFLDREYARLWVNGKKDPEGNWTTLYHKPVFQQLNWLDGDSSTGECLTILRRNHRNKMSFQGWVCSGIAWGYCEYINPFKV